MKICEIAYNWPAETFIQRHLRALQEHGVNVKLIARHGHSEKSSGASVARISDGLCGEVMPNFDHLSRFQKFWSLRYIRPGRFALPVRGRVLLGYFERLQPDLIHFHDASLAASMCWIPLVLDIPYTLSLRGSDIQVLTLQSSTQKGAIISAIEGAAKVHAVCNALGRTAVRLLGHELNFSVIYTTLPILSALPDRKDISDGGQFHLISSGRLVWMKRFDNLLIALRRLRDIGVDARLTIVGVGPELEHLLYLRKALGLESVVDLPGKLTYEQISVLLGSAHAYLQSSIAEGLSNSLVEAMTHGLPVFATDVGGTSEVIEDGVSGFLLPPFAPQDWMERLMLVQDKARMEAVRAAAYIKAGQLFSPEKHAHSFREFFDETVNVNA